MIDKFKPKTFMKTKILLIAIAAITLLLSLLFHPALLTRSSAKKEVKGNQSGFALQDSNQF